MAWSLDSVMFLLEELQPAFKVPRHPNITSEVKDDNSEQLKLSEAQSRQKNG